MIANSLTLIENWLATHAPRILHESLNPGATEADVAALATAIGRPLPADYQALYHWHDGLREDADNWGSFCYGMSLLPLAEVQAAYSYQAADRSTSPLLRAAPGVQAGRLQNPYWLRLGFDWSHGWLLVDLDPTPTGTYGQVLYMYEIEELAFPVARSVAELLATFADDLARGLYTLDAEALEDDNEFLVPDARINLDNWAQTARWRDALTA